MPTTVSMPDRGRRGRLRVVADRPADGWLTSRVELLSGFVSGTRGEFALTARCAGRDVPLRPCLHREMAGDPTACGFWALLTMGEWIEEERDGVLSIELSWEGAHLGTLPLRISPIAREVVRRFPISSRRFRIATPASQPEAGLLVFPGLGGVGGASLDELMRMEVYRQGGSVPVYHEADHPRLWQRLAGEAGRVPPFRWIGGHDCRDAGYALGVRFRRVTLLRDPVRRLVSLFHYNSLVHPREFPFRTLEELVDSGEVRRHSQLEGLLRARGIPDVDRFSEADLVALARDELERAYAFVGITERFEESIFRICRLGGFSSVGLWWRVLSSPHGTPLERVPSRLRRRLERLLIADGEVYEERRAAFTEACGAADSGPELEAYRRESAAMAELSPEHKAFECLRWRQLLIESALEPLEGRTIATLEADGRSSLRLKASSIAAGGHEDGFGAAGS